MNKPLFTGVCTALVTPFQEGRISFPMLEQLIQRQVQAHIPAIVVAGTTGESAALSVSEKIKLIEMSKKFAGQKCKIIAGTGTNDTVTTIELSKAAEQAGADALLVVCPYYNKPTPEGLLAHYLAVASSVHIPLIIYNVPSRTGLDISVNIYRQLAQIPNIAGVKEAKADMTKILKIRSECPETFCVWSGNDDHTVPVISVGGKGVISVLSNVFPELMQAAAAAALDGDFDTASALQVTLQPLAEALFSETNPIPLKAAMKLIGYDCGDCRMPLPPASPETLNRIRIGLNNLQNH